MITLGWTNGDLVKPCASTGAAETDPIEAVVVLSPRWIAVPLLIC